MNEGQINVKRSRRGVLALGLKGILLGAAGLAVRETMPVIAAQSGRAYAFLIRDAVINLGDLEVGHVAVGVQGATGRFVYMSKDGPLHSYLPCDQSNKFWVRSGSEGDMLDNMHRLGYWEYANVWVNNADTGAASRAATGDIPGYCLFGNNCLDLTYQTLNGYGAPGLQSPQDYPNPSDWFDALSGDWTYGGWA